MAEGNGIYHRQNKSVCLLEGKSRGIDKTKKSLTGPGALGLCQWVKLHLEFKVLFLGLR